jgi:glycosyltransferase involved in cell wall biosynthesis
MPTHPARFMVRDPEHPGAEGRTALLLAPIGWAHHFQGLTEALARRGLRARLEYLQPWSPVRVTRGMAAEADVLVYDARAERVCHAAARAGKPLVLLMDGIVEYANTFFNTGPGPRFLSPAAADVVIAAGLHDRALLRAMGNRAVAAGLPRLSAFARNQCNFHDEQEPAGLLVATANRPAFTFGGRVRLLTSLARLKDAAQKRSLPVRWRIARDLAETLQVEVDHLALGASFARSRAVITTASTLALEAMLAGRPTAVLHPHPWPLWLPSAWVWRGEDRDGAEDDRQRMRALDGADARVNAAAAESVAAALGGRDPHTTQDVNLLLDSLLSPDRSRLAQQGVALKRCCREDADERAAGAIDAVARQSPRHRPEFSVPARLAPTTRTIRVVSCVETGRFSVSSVASWSERMERHFLAHPELGIDWRTLFIGSLPPSPFECLDQRPRAHVCAIDAADSPMAQVDRICEAFTALSANVVLPNYGELSNAASMHHRNRGTRVIAIAHANDSLCRRLLSTYDRWDAAVAAGPACAGWVSRLAQGREIAEIHYGVPMPEPQAVKPVIGAPIRLAYVGRVVEPRKRVSDLLIVLAELRRLNVPFEFHMVGDGEALIEWERNAQRLDLPSGCLHVHGPRPRAWVQAFYRTIDISLITSDEEGISVSTIEAMAAEVLPCVARADESIDALLSDGENAIVAAVGNLKAMARRIGELDRDRGALRRCAAGARATVERCRLTLAACAEHYASLLRRVNSGPRRAEAATDLGLRTPGVAATSHAATFEHDIERHLRAAGFRHIAHGSPSTVRGDEPPAVIIRATDPHPGSARIAEWRARGIGVGVEPTLSDDARAHFTHDFEQLRLAGCSRIALCVDPEFLPALEWIAERRRSSIFGVLHHLAWPGSTLMGVPAFTVQQAGESEPPPDGVVFAELQGYAATHTLRRRGVRCVVGPAEAPMCARIDAMLDRVADSIARGRPVLTTAEGVIPGATAVGTASIECAERPDVLVLRGDEIDFKIFASARAWRDRGTAVHSLRWSDDELSSPERFAELVDRLPEPCSYAVYGGGLHTERLLKHSRPARPPACIIDDRAREGQRIQGVAVVRPDDPAVARIGVIILSSTRFEPELWERSAPARAAGVRVLPLYATAGQLESRGTCAAASM